MVNRPIRSTGNARIVELRKLVQRKQRRKQDRFAAEGLQILRAAVEAITSSRGRPRVRPLEVFYCENLFTSETAPGLLESLRAAGAEPVPVTEAVLETVSRRVHSQGLVATFAAASMASPLTAWPPPVTGRPTLYVLIDRPQYPGNVGTVVRTADAVGASGVLLVEPAADPLDPKAVRASMGSVFSVPIASVAAPDDLIVWSARSGLQWVAADVEAGDPIWETDALEGTVGLILGNEAAGPQPRIRALADRIIHLPQRGRADSLNVAVAGGILMYEWLRANGGT
jgi:TrmH family RNA methyltransferase